MNGKAWFALVAAAGWLASVPAWAQTRCEFNQVGVLPLEFNNNEPLVEVVINGAKSKMLIDTGASKTIMFAPKMREMGLTPVPSDTDFYGVGGVRKALVLTLGSFGIGGATAKNLQLFALETGRKSDAVGILGEDLLVNLDVEFDLAAKQLRLFKEKDCGGLNLGYWSKEPAVADMEGLTDLFGLRVKLNGATVHAQLDSGSQTTVVTLETAARVGVRPVEEQLDKLSAGLGANKVATATLTFSTLAVGDEEIKNAKLAVADLFKDTREANAGSHIRTSDSDATEMLLGADFLRSHRVLVAKGQHRIYFTYQGGPVFQVIAPVGDAVAIPPATK